MTEAVVRGLRATYGMDQGLIDALTQRHIGLDDPNVAPVFAQREPVQVADLREGNCLGPQRDYSACRLP
jgi:hypothetical protein